MPKMDITSTFFILAVIAKGASLLSWNKADKRITLVSTYQAVSQPCGIFPSQDKSFIL